MSAARGRLAKLSKKKRNLKPRVETLEDVIIGSIGDSVQRLKDIHAAAGESLTKVDVGGGIVVDVTLPPSGVQDWEQRLWDLHEAAQDLTMVHDSISEDFERVAWTLMRSDGWVLNRYSLKTPGWMVPPREIPYRDLGSIAGWIHAIQDWRDRQNT